MIRQIKSTDHINFIEYCLNKELCKTMKSAYRLFNDTQKRGTKCSIYEDKGIKGLLLIAKENDKKYVSLISDNNIIAIQLMKQYIWGSTESLYVKFPKWNPLVKSLTRLGFRITSKRGDATVDLFRQFDKKFYFPIQRMKHYE